MSRGHWYRRVRALLALYVAAATLGPSAATAQTEELGAFNGRAAASGLHALYTPEGLIPTAALFDFGTPDALATISTGPATFARASIADPGEVLANPDALIAQGGGEPGTVPPYPYRASANSSVGEPTAESSPAPGIGAKVSAEPTAANAEAVGPGFEGAAIATIGSSRSTASATTDGGTVTVHATTELGDFDLLRGLLRIESMVIDLTATSDGTNTTVSGGTTVTGATVAGTPVTIDEDGVHAQDPPEDGEQPSGDPLSGLNDGVRDVLGSGVPSLNEQLGAAGIQVALVRPEELGDDQNRVLRASGLRIDIGVSSSTVPALQALLDSLPFVPPPAPGAPGLSDVIALARAKQLIGLEVGRAQVSLDARLRRPRPDVAAPPAAPIASGTASPVPGAVDLAPPPARPAVGPRGELSGAPPIPVQSSSSTFPTGAGIAALALLGLIVAPFLGDRLSAFAGWYLPEPADGTCPGSTQ